MLIFEGTGSAFSKILGYQRTLSYGVFRCSAINKSLLKDVFLYAAENEGQIPDKVPGFLNLIFFWWELGP